MEDEWLSEKQQVTDRQTLSQSQTEIFLSLNLTLGPYNVSFIQNTVPNWNCLTHYCAYPAICLSSLRSLPAACLNEDFQLKFNEPDLIWRFSPQMAFVESVDQLFQASYPVDAFKRQKPDADNLQAKLSSWDNSGVAWIAIKHNPASQWVNT